MTITEQFILLQAPTPAAAQNGRKLSGGGKFSARQKTADETLYWAQCAGSGKTPYHTSIDFIMKESPVCRCSCPSRQFPCKHALGLMFEILAGKEFKTADIPEDIAQKREKQAAKAAKKEAEKDAPKKPKRVNAAAQEKKLKRQLEGLDMAEKMTNSLLTAGIGTLAGSSAQSFEKLAKDLSGYYLTGPQTAFLRIALAVRTIQKNPKEAEAAYEEALRILISLNSIIKKGRQFLNQKLEAGKFSAEDNVLFQALGGVWKLEDLHEIGAFKKDARLVQLSFDSALDEAKKEYVERGFWLDLDSGEISQTQNLRPVKALKYVKADDSCFELLEIPMLYTYPGEGNRRIRWDGFISRPLTDQEQKRCPQLSQPGISAAVKAAKGLMKNTLMPKYLAVMVPVARIGKIGENLVLEDTEGSRILLRDRQEDGKSHACVCRIPSVAGAATEGSALFGQIFYDSRDRRICLHPYSLVTPKQIIRLKY